MSGKTGIQWTDEVWRTIPSWPRYEVTPTGTIRNCHTGRIMKLRPHEGLGHLYFMPARGKKMYAHRAVLEAYIGPCPEGMECRHLDGNPKNNAVDNLAWGTRLENADDTRRHGRKRAASYAQSPLTASQVTEIKRLLPYMTRRSLATLFRVSHTTINKIAQGKRWQEVAA